MRMPDEERYSMLVGDMGQQERDLYECLLRIAGGDALDPRADALLGRLIRGGLVDSVDGVLTLTAAGVRRCQSLQFREDGDVEASHVRSDRDQK